MFRSHVVLAMFVLVFWGREPQHGYGDQSDWKGVDPVKDVAVAWHGGALCKQVRL